MHTHVCVRACVRVCLSVHVFSVEFVEPFHVNACGFAQCFLHVMIWHASAGA